jgi:hypothetical protein
MLAIDGGLLAAVIVLGRKQARHGALLPAARAGLTLAWVLAGLALSAAVILRGARQAGDDPASKRPGYYVTKTGDWQGERWSELELAAYMSRQPQDVDEGQRYVIFYSRSCDHCQALFERYFSAPAPVPTTIVAIPETKAGFTRETWLEMHCEGCEELELPAGTDWIMTTPIVVALEDGKVVCAKEGEDAEAPQCLVWH